MVMPPFSQKVLLRIVLALAVVASLGGIAYAVIWGEAGDGGRGGAVAVALSFLALFAGRATPNRVLEIEDGRGRKVVHHGSDQRKIRLLRTAIAAMIDSQRLETTYLTGASVFGTLVWGFGDKIALWLGATP